jgi:hypothetical protein
VFGHALADDFGQARRRLTRPPAGATWVQTLQQEGLQPTDLLMGEMVTKFQFYFGHADFYVESKSYERFTYQAPSGSVRSLYTDASLVTNRGDFERLVEEPNPGRTLWVLSLGDDLKVIADEIDPNLWLSMTRSADKIIKTRDGWVVLKITLPRHAGSA